MKYNYLILVTGETFYERERGSGIVGNSSLVYTYWTN